MEKTLTIGQVADIMSLVYAATYDDLDKIREQLRDILNNDEEVLNILYEHLVSIASAHHNCDYSEQMMLAFGPDYRNNLR